MAHPRTLSSDSEDDLAALCGISEDAMINIQEAEEEAEIVTVDALLQDVEVAIIETSANLLEKCRENAAKHSSVDHLADVLDLAELIIKGEYGDVLRSPFAAAFFLRLKNSKSEQTLPDHRLTTVLYSKLDTIFHEDIGQTGVKCYAVGVLALSVALLNLFVQANYTGPAFDPASVSDIHPLTSTMDIESSWKEDVVKGQGTDKEEIHFHSASLLVLQVDGDLPHTKCEFPYFLMMSRILFHFLARSQSTDWTVSKADDSVEAMSSFGGVLAVQEEETPVYNVNMKVSNVLCSILRTSSLWNARAAVAHERLLIHQLPSPTLWMEVKQSFETLRNTLSTAVKQWQGTDLIVRIHLEWGLAQHFFEQPLNGKKSFQDAKEASGLRTEMTAALGKRTKYQKKSLPQMMLHAESKVTPDEAVVSESAKAFADCTPESFGGNKKEGDDDDVHDDDDDDDKEDEKVKQLVDDGEAAYRSISLEQANPDNILLEKIKFEDESFSKQKNLQVIDQAIILALCLDVANNNPKHGLTREQMVPYVTRVLENPNNWMVYSTGLLEKAWLECERHHSIERAVLQMQALVDQHTTRLSIMQNTYESIEESAPACERLAFIYCLVFPPRYALRKDLAERYFKLGVIRSALTIFEELEMWDEIVQCYRVIEKPKRAEKIVRERLEIAPTPTMWCCLGDLSENEEEKKKCYLTAWQLSRGQNARSKRSLGSLAISNGELEEGIAHYIDSLRAQAQNPGAWFSLGVGAMRAKKWDLSLQAFTRVVQQEPASGEAWGNIGSVHLRVQNFSKAHIAFQEALKQKRSLWQMWENFLLCSMEIKKFGDAIYAFHQLLDLREKHKRPVDHEMLAWLIEQVVFETKESLVNESSTDSSSTDREQDLNEDEPSSVIKSTPPLSNSHYDQQVAKLLGRITSMITNDPKVWQLYAHFNDGMGRKSKALDCRLKMCRALQTAGWDNDADKTAAVCKAAVRLAEDYIEEGSKKSLYSCRLYLRGILKKSQVTFADLAEVVELNETFERVEGLESKAT